ncbi:MAG: NADP-dependent isocitrate dehydrogenase, partial [Nitrospirae bacterium]
EVIGFANKLERAVKRTIEDGIMTKDLALIAEPKVDKYVYTEEFIRAVKDRLDKEEEIR